MERIKGICFICGKRLIDAVGHPINPVERTIDGNPVKMHKNCSKSFDLNKPVTAAEKPHA